MSENIMPNTGGSVGAPGSDPVAVPQGGDKPKHLRAKKRSQAAARLGRITAEAALLSSEAGQVQERAAESALIEATATGTAEVEQLEAAPAAAPEPMIAAVRETARASHDYRDLVTGLDPGTRKKLEGKVSQFALEGMSQDEAELAAYQWWMAPTDHSKKEIPPSDPENPFPSEIDASKEIKEPGPLETLESRFAEKGKDAIDNATYAAIRIALESEAAIALKMRDRLKELRIFTDINSQIKSDRSKEKKRDRDLEKEKERQRKQVELDKRQADKDKAKQDEMDAKAKAVAEKASAEAAEAAEMQQSMRAQRYLSHEIRKFSLLPATDLKEQIRSVSYRIGTLLYLGYFTELEFRRRLLQISGDFALPEDEIQQAIQAGLDEGRQNPGDIPDFDDRPQTYSDYVEHVDEAFSLEKGAPLPRARRRFYAGSDQDLSNLSKRLWKAISEIEQVTPVLFRHLGKRVRCSEKVIKNHKSFEPEILTPELLMAYLTHRFAWYQTTKNGEEYDCAPPLAIAKLMIAEMESDIPHNLPELVSIVYIPVFTPDERLLNKPGFDRKSGIFYLPTCKIPPIPEEINEEDLKAAKELLEEMLNEFPFSDSADHDNYVGLLITFFVRQMFRGLVPFFLAEASTPGAGKGTLMELVKIIVFGSGGGWGFTTMTNDENELRKEITSHLLAGKGAVLFDNLAGEINCAPLAALLTSTSWDNRLLGSNTTARIQDASTVWLGTGNNAQFTQELVRRIIPIRLTPNTDRPELREFNRPLIFEWAEKRRGELIRAILILVLHWRQLGSPDGHFSLNSYNRFCMIVSGILEAADYTAFGSNMRRFSNRADSQRSARASFCNIWYESLESDLYSPTTRTKAITAGKLLEIIDNRVEGLPIKGDSPRARQTSFGRYLKESEDAYPTWQGLNWEPIKTTEDDSAAAVAEAEDFNTKKLKRFGSSRWVQRVFKIYTEGRVNDCPAWFCELSEETNIPPQDHPKSEPPELPEPLQTHACAKDSDDDSGENKSKKELKENREGKGINKKDKSSPSNENSSKKGTGRGSGSSGGSGEEGEEEGEWER